MAFPLVRSSRLTVQGTNSSSWTLTFPFEAGDIKDGGGSYVQAGDLVIINIGRDGTAGTGSIPGYTLLFNQAAGSAARGLTFARVATGSEGNVTYSPGASEQGVARIAVIKNWWGTIATGVAVGGSATASSNQPNPGSLNPGWGALDIYWRACAAWDDGGINATGFPSNFTDNQNADASGGGAGAGLGSGGYQLNAASVDPGIFQLDGADDWRAWVIAVRPSSSVPVATQGTVRQAGRNRVSTLKTLYPLGPARQAGRLLATTATIIATAASVHFGGRVQAQTSVVYPTATTAITAQAGRLQVPVARNVIPNGDYETDAAGSQPFNSTIARDNTHGGYRGSWALKITTQATNSGCEWRTLVGGDFLQVRPDRVYRFESHVYATGDAIGKEVLVQLFQYNYALGLVRTDTGDPVVLVAGWNTVRLDTPPTLPATFKALCLFRTNGDQGVVEMWVDGASLIPLNVGAFVAYPTPGVVSKAGRVQAETSVSVAAANTPAVAQGVGRIQAEMATLIATAATIRDAGRVQSQTAVAEQGDTPALIQAAGRVGAQTATEIATPAAIRQAGRIRVESSAPVPGIDTPATIQQAGRLQVTALKTLYPVSPVRQAGRVQAASSVAVPGTIDTEGTVRQSGRAQADVDVRYAVGPIRQLGRVQAETTVPVGTIDTEAAIRGSGRVQAASSTLIATAAAIRSAGRLQVATTVSYPGTTATESAIRQAGRIGSVMDLDYEIGPIRQAARVLADTVVQNPTAALSGAAGRIQAETGVVYDSGALIGVGARLQATTTLVSAIATSGAPQGVGRIQGTMTVRSETLATIQSTGRLQADTTTLSATAAVAQRTGRIQAASTVSYPGEINTEAAIRTAGRLEADTTIVYPGTALTPSSIQAAGRIQAASQTTNATAASIHSSGTVWAETTVSYAPTPTETAAILSVAGQVLSVSSASYPGDVPTPATVGAGARIQAAMLVAGVLAYSRDERTLSWMNQDWRSFPWPS